MQKENRQSNEEQNALKEEVKGDLGDILRLPVMPKERYDLRILSAIRRIIRAVDIYSCRLAQEHKVTVPQLMCMLKIDELGAMTIKDLSEEVYMSPSTLVGIVDRLEKNKVLFRERSVKDRRKIRISLTEKGKEMVAKSPSPLQDALADAIEDLPELERATIALSLDRIIEMMETKKLPMGAADAAPILETGADLDSKVSDSPNQDS